jgi:hypothetical protein
MSIVKHFGNVTKQLGSASIIPGVSDAINKFVDTATGDAGKTQDERIKALEAEVAAGRKTKEQAQMEAQQRANQGMKAGGRVKSASARADGCAVRGKTRA